MGNYYGRNADLLYIIYTFEHLKRHKIHNKYIKTIKNIYTILYLITK